MRTLLRFLRRLVVATTSGVLIVAALLVLGWLLGGSWVAARISSLANQRLFADRSTRLHVGRVTGSLFSDVTLEDVRLERRVGKEWRAMVEADRMEARYDLGALVSGRAELSVVRIREPRITISQDSTGRWVLPMGAQPGDRASASRRRLALPSVQIDEGHLRLIGPRREWEARDVSIHGGVEVTGGRVDVRLDRASFQMLEPVGRVEELAGRLVVDGRRLAGQDVRLRWEGSALDGDFSWDPADSLEGLHATASFSALPLGRLRGLTGVGLLPASGTLNGAARVSGGRRDFAFEADLSGRYGDRAVDTLRVAGRRTGSVIRADRLRLLMPECDLAGGSGTIDLARGGHLRAALEFRHLQVDSVPVKAVRWIPGVARGNLDLELANFLRGHGPLAVTADIDFTGDRAFGIELSGARGHLEYTEGSDALLRDVTLLLPDGGEVQGGGAIHPGSLLDIDFTVDTGDWSAFRPVILIPGLGGAGRAVGRLVGTDRQPAVEVSGDFTRVTGWEMAADSVRLERLTGPFAPEAEFDGAVTAETLHTLGRILDHVEMEFHWREPRLTFPRLHAIDADTVADTRGWTDFDPARNAMKVTLESGSLGIGPLVWVPDRPVIVDGVGKRFDVRPARYTSDAGSATVEARFDNDAGTMDARFNGLKIDLKVMAGAGSPPEFHGGELTGDLRLTGPVTLPDPSGRLVFHDYRWARAVVDSALFDFQVRSSRLDVREGWAEAGAGRLSFAGGADLPEAGWLVWNRWTAKKPIAWERVILDNVEVRGRDVDVPRWAACNPKLDVGRGRADGVVRASGALGAPRATLEARLAGLASGRYQVDSLLVAARYEPDRLAIGHLRLVRESALSNLSGEVPLRLSLAPPAAELLDRPMDVTVDLPRTDLSLLPLFVKGIDKAAGDLSGHVELRGTPKRYLATGDLELKGASIQLKQREEVVEDLTARVRLDGTTVRLVSLSAREGTTGRLSGQGTFELGAAPERAYRLELDLVNFVVRQSADYAARFNGHFEIVPLRLADGTVRPMTIGDVKVDRAEIIRELDKPQPAVEPGQEFFYSISIDAPRGLFIVNDVVDMELRGELTARRTPERSELIGQLEILRGTYTLLLRRFNITSGTLTFNRLDLIDPTIDITAQTSDAEYVITIHITGEASNPVIQFTAEPGRNGLPELTEEEILNRLAPGGTLTSQALKTGISSEQLGNLGVNVLAGSFQVLLAQVQRDLARRLGFEIRFDSPGVSDSDLSRGLSSYGVLSVSKWVTPDVSVRYSQGLAGTQQQDLSMEYRLGRLLFLRGEIIRRRTISIEEEYNIDLRFWHEY